MLLFIILLPLNISSTCLGSDLTLLTRTVTLSPETAFFLLWKTNHFVSDIHIPAMHFYLPLSHTFYIPLENKNYQKFLSY